MQCPKQGQALKLHCLLQAWSRVLSIPPRMKMLQRLWATCSSVLTTLSGRTLWRSCMHNETQTPWCYSLTKQLSSQRTLRTFKNINFYPTPLCPSLLLMYSIHLLPPSAPKRYKHIPRHCSGFTLRFTSKRVVAFQVKGRISPFPFTWWVYIKCSLYQPFPSIY